MPVAEQVMLTNRQGEPVSYLRLHYFSSQASKDLAAAVLEGESLGVAGYLIDLRNNPGAQRALLNSCLPLGWPQLAWSHSGQLAAC